jgi:hypothetical protein
MNEEEKRPRFIQPKDETFKPHYRKLISSLRKARRGSSFR